MAVRVTAAHTAEARAEAGRDAGEGGVAAAATALAPGGFLGLPAPFSEEGNRAGRGRGGGGAARADGGPDGLSCERDELSQTPVPCGPHGSPRGPSEPSTSPQPRFPQTLGPLLRSVYHSRGPWCPFPDTHRCPRLRG